MHGRKPYTRVNALPGSPDAERFSPWHPVQEEATLADGEDKSVMEEDEGQVCVKRTPRGGTPRLFTYKKAKSDDGQLTQYMDVASIEAVGPPIEEVINQWRDAQVMSNKVREYHRLQAQTKRDQAADQKHEANAKLHARKHPEWYSPIEGELVDHQSSINPESTDSWKLRQTWLAPYRVVWKPDHDFTCGIQKVNAQTLNVMAKTVTRVAVEDL